VSETEGKDKSFYRDRNRTNNESAVKTMIAGAAILPLLWDNLT
jgi:hypothetical protein